MSRVLWAGWLSLMLLPTTGAMAAAGSWVASAPAVRVAVPGRQYVSAPLGASEPERLAGRRIVSVRWHYRVAQGQAVRAWLCQDSFCMRVPGRQGGNRMDVPLDAASPWQFRFELPPGERQAVLVQGLGLIVNYH
ncbi:flagellar protein FlhE [Zobellella aerophila]|uniref:Flagellar protein FlhE n=1 Tax=Zobellella aerophila TaxID=870480 RepID=A0ABP6VQY4_9GAMM